ncbi:unnamed protein product [Owenia fusiformis]|uniref:Centrosomal protein of 44 kDa n=1 Tax=Owenia fusiformis TaxID=6347 RepID=A0A8S4N8Q6_OWEFU|nr:unnamed protein product [Owenia fusiformis]
MTTGDIKNNIRKLQLSLKLAKYPETDDLDITSLSKGQAATYLPIYHYLFTNYSVALAERLSEKNVELFSKTDLSFMQAVYKILRDVFNYKPPVTKDQFFSAGFAERKIIMCSEIIDTIRLQFKPPKPKSKLNCSLLSSQTRPSAQTSSTHNKSASATKETPVLFKKPESPPLQQRVAPLQQHVDAVTYGEDKCASATSLPLPQVIREPVSVRGCEKQPIGPIPAHIWQEKGYHTYNTPSIARVQSAFVEVVNIPKGETANSPRVLDIMAHTPARGSIQHTDMGARDYVETANTFAHTEQLNRILEMLDERTGQIQSMQHRLNDLEQHLPKIKPPSLDFDDTQPMHSPKKENIDNHLRNERKMDDILARLVLLETRMQIVESKMNNNTLDSKERNRQVLSDQSNQEN